MKTKGKRARKGDSVMAGWATQELGALATVSAGNSAPQDKSLFKGGQHPFVRTADVGKIRFGIINSTSGYLNDAGIANLRRFPRGTILFPKSGASTYLNHRVMMGFDGYVANHLATIQAAREKIDPKFLLYFLHTVDAKDLVQDQSYPSLNLPLIQSIPVPLPSLPEQKRIVAILDKAFTAIETATANTKRNIANVQELFESALDCIFRLHQFDGNSGGVEWEKCSIGEMCEVVAGQSPKSIHYNTSGEGLPFYQGKKEFGEKYLGAPEKWTTRVTSEAVAGDILMSVRAPVGPINFATEKICIGRGLAAIRVGKKIQREFLFYVLLHMQDQIKGNEGAVFASINKKQIEDIRFRKPPLSVQKQIVSVLDKMLVRVDAATVNAKSKIDALTNLKQSVLHRAFAGKLTANTVAGRIARP